MSRPSQQSPVVSWPAACPPTACPPVAASHGLPTFPFVMRRDGGPEPVIAMPVLPRRRHEVNEPVHEVIRREFDHAAGARPLRQHRLVLRCAVQQNHDVAAPARDLSGHDPTVGIQELPQARGQPRRHSSRCFQPPQHPSCRRRGTPIAASSAAGCRCCNPARDPQEIERVGFRTDGVAIRPQVFARESSLRVRPADAPAGSG